MNRGRNVNVHRRLTLEILEDRTTPSAITPATLPIPTVGNLYNVSIADTGATGTYTLSESGALPAGLTFTGGQTGSQITHVQDAGLGETSSGTSQSTTSFAKTPVTGDAIIVWAWGWNNATVTAAEVTCTDTGKDSYTQYGFVDGGTSNGNWSCLFVASNVTGAANFKDTINLSGVPNGNIAVVASEFSGVAGVDATGTNSGTTAAPSIKTTTSNTNDVLCAIMASNNTKNPATVTTPSGWTQTGVVTDGNSYEVGQAIYRVVTSTNTYTAQWNNIGTTAWGTGIVVLKGSAASSGSLSGTPTTAGTSTFTITGTDSAGNVASQQYSLTVNPVIVVSQTTLPVGISGQGYSATFTATGGSGSGYTLGETGTLPTGLAFSDGTLSGTPTQAGSFAITVTATDSNGATGSVTDTLTVNPATSSLTLSPTTLPNAVANSPYSYHGDRDGRFGFLHLQGQLREPSFVVGLEREHGSAERHADHHRHVRLHHHCDRQQDLGLTGSQAYTLTVGTSANPARPQPTTLNTASSQYQNLVAVFPLWITSSTADTLDYGPHGLVGTPTNIQVHTDPIMGNVFYASGSARNFAVPYNTYLDFAYPNDTAQPFTVSCWVNITIPSTSLTNANNPPNMYAWTFDTNSLGRPTRLWVWYSRDSRPERPHRQRVGCRRASSPIHHVRTNNH